MKIRRIAAAELDSGLQARWQQLRADDHALDSPYFSVEYVQAAARACSEVYVGVAEVDGQVQGFFPFQMKSRRVAGPVGGQLSDWHGIVGAAGQPWDVATLLRGCGLDIWDFDHLPASQACFASHVSASATSPVLDLGEGYAAYLNQRKAAGSQRPSQIERKARGFERKLGPLRFEVDCRDRKAFEQVLRWKRDQCLRTGVPDFLSWGWTTDLLERLWATETPDLAGRLSVLWHGDTVVAGHYGMRSQSVWHWWFPTYNAAFAEHSPGGILLLRQAEAVAAAGLRVLDLGKGEDAYKLSFASSALPLYEGSVLVPSLTSTLRRTRLAGRRWVHSSPALNQVWSRVRPLRDWLQGRGAASAASAPP